MAIRFPLSPPLADLFMRVFEKRELDEYSSRPKLWRRYVDDIFVIWQIEGENLDRFLVHLNNIEESMKFNFPSPMF